MLSLFVELQDRVATITLMYARILPIFLLLPVFNTSAISSIIVRNSLMFVIIIGLWPSIDTTLPISTLDLGAIGALTFKEGLIGLSLGLALALPFWIFSALGAYIDVARGASLGNLIDPTSGQESTEAANLINFCVIVVYLELGGMRYFMETLFQSYQTMGLTQGFTINIGSVISFLSHVITEGFILASPILLMLLLSECLLGLFSRFTPQLNAFSVSLTLKSVIAFFILLMYFWQVFPEKLLIFMSDYSSLQILYGGK